MRNNGIELDRGCVAIVDDEDYPILVVHKWFVNLSGYAARTQKIGGRTVTYCPVNEAA